MNGDTDPRVWRQFVQNLKPRLVPTQEKEIEMKSDDKVLIGRRSGETNLRYPSNEELREIARQAIAQLDKDTVSSSENEHRDRVAGGLEALDYNKIKVDNQTHEEATEVQGIVNFTVNLGGTATAVVSADNIHFWDATGDLWLTSEQFKVLLGELRLNGHIVGFTGHYGE